ncbi:solute carrier family 35 member F6 [Lampetra fluviatilis]
MAWTRYQLFLAFLMLITGSINTLSAKWADTSLAPGCDPNSEPREFNHPFLQASGMFLGELSCLFVYLLHVVRERRTDPGSSVSVRRSVRPIFVIPALCDMTATSLMYIALNLTSASSFQMLRGAVVVFTGLLSVGFLGRRLTASHWAGVGLTIAGLVVVGMADFLSGGGGASESHRLSEIITGDLLIILAQIVAAVQMVVEEKFIYKDDIHPLQAVGNEGLFGFSILSLLLIPMYFIPARGFSDNPRGVLEDALDGFCQMGHSSAVAGAVALNVLSIAFFNFAGISVTKEMSATTRMVLDSLRTVVIWAVSLILRWESFKYLQVIGFIILLSGAVIYNGLLSPVVTRCRGHAQTQEETTSLIRDEP